MNPVLKEALEFRQKFDILHRLILKGGKEYRPEPLPEDLSVGIPKECFANAGRSALFSPYSYVEGVAVMKDIGFPFHHAWLTEPGSDKAFDVTLKNPENYLFCGFEFDTDVLSDTVNETGCWGILNSGISYNIELFESLCPGILKEHEQEMNEWTELMASMKGATQ